MTTGASPTAATATATGMLTTEPAVTRDGHELQTSWTPHHSTPQMNVSMAQRPAAAMLPTRAAAADRRLQQIRADSNNDAMHRFR